MNHTGGWMGLAFGDLNGDGFLDMFATNFGDFPNIPFSPFDPVYIGGAVFELGELSTRWFLGGSGGVFTDPGVGDLVATPFGWGVSLFDYDNDADGDIVYHGSLSAGPVTHADNPGVILNNDGAAHFTWDAAALAASTNHQRRTVHGVAVGDLNDKGRAP